MHDESGSLPPFPDHIWEEKMKAAYGEDGPPAGGSVATLEREEETTLGQALGLPEPFLTEYEDLWPGYAYKLKLKQLEQVIPLLAQVQELYNAGKVMESVNAAADVLCIVAFHIEGEREPRPVTKDEVLESFDEEEIAAVLAHITNKQGLKVEADEGNAHSGRWTGLKSFAYSAASTGVTPSKPAVNSP